MKKNRAISVMIALVCVIVGVSCLLHGAQTTPSRTTRDVPLDYGWSNPDHGVPAMGSTRAAAIVPVRAELAALRRGDEKAAEHYELYAPGVPYPGPAQLHMMLLHNYPELANYTSVEFLDVRARRDDPTSISVTAIVVGKRGGRVLISWITKLVGTQYRIVNLAEVARIGGPVNPPGRARYPYLMMGPRPPRRDLSGVTASPGL